MENYLDWKYTFFEQDGLSVYIAYIPNKLKEITNPASNLKRTFSNPIVDILLFILRTKFDCFARIDSSLSYIAVS